MSKWFVVRCVTRREAAAREALKELKVETYLPQLTRWKRTHKAKSRVQAPLFPGYLFALFDDEMAWVIEKADGVHGVLRTRGEAKNPVSVPPGEISRLRDIENSGEFDTTRRRKRNDPKSGDVVKIIGGQFKGFPAQFASRRDDDRIEVMLTLFGRTSSLLLKEADVDGMGVEEAA